MIAMTQYELMTITDLNVGEDGARSISNQIKDIITAKKGKILDSDFWGKRKFSYEIDHKDEGFYEVIKFELDSEEVPDVKLRLNLINGLTRYLVTTE